MSYKLLQLVTPLLGHSSNIRHFSVATSTTIPSIFTTHDHKKIRVHTCKQVYKEKGNYFLFRNCPKEGIHMDIDYLDSNPNASSSTPTVMAIHGAGVSYQDFGAMIHQMRNKEIRLIAPNFPNMAFTDQTGTFRHTTQEKMELISDWLKAIDVHRIDVAVMHSSACFPGMRLWKYQPDLMKSLVMISPAGHRRIKAMKPVWKTNLISWVNLVEPGRKLYGTLGTMMLKAFKVRVKHEGEGALDTAALACITMYLATFERMIQYFKMLKEQRVPSSFIYGDRDKLVDHKIFLEMIQMLGADTMHTSFYDKAGLLVKECDNLIEDDWLRISCIQGGGHYAFKSTPQLLEDEITRLLLQVYKTDVVDMNQEQIQPSPRRQITL